jgi:mannose-1-phosphate guanylyltransferase
MFPFRASPMLAELEKTNRTKDVKAIVDKHETAGAPESKAHRPIYRHWGSCDCTTEGECWQIKKVVVNSRACLSLQKQLHRADH